MNITYLVLLSVIVISQSINLELYHDRFHECYDTFKKAHWKGSRSRNNKVDRNHQSFYHPTGGLTDHYINYHTPDHYPFWTTQNYRNHEFGEPDGFLYFNTNATDKNQANDNDRRETKFDNSYRKRIHEACFLTCIIKKFKMYDNLTDWNYENIYKHVGGIENVTKAAAFYCITNNKKDNECDSVYAAVKCYIESLGINACKPKKKST